MVGSKCCRQCWVSATQSCRRLDLGKETNDIGLSNFEAARDNGCCLPAARMGRRWIFGAAIAGVDGKRRRRDRLQSNQICITCLISKLLDDFDQPSGALSAVVSAASVSRMMVHCLDGEDVVGDNRHQRRWSELVVAVVFPDSDRPIGRLLKLCRTAAMTGCHY
ncbi:hypothetical protein ACLOJK_000438 [Asimina triloba]